MDDCVEFANEEEGKAWCGRCNESWNLVSPWAEALANLEPSHMLIDLSLQVQAQHP